MISTLLRILLLILAWAALQGSLGVGSLLFGALTAWAVLQISQPIFNPEGRRLRKEPRPIRWTWRTIVLLVVFLREVVLSALQVAWQILQPSPDIRPAIIEYPLNVQTDREITTLANMISLTPGTLSLDVAPDRSCLYVHAISVKTEDGQEVIDDIKGSLEKHVSRALGPPA